MNPSNRGKRRIGSRAVSLPIIALFYLSASYGQFIMPDPVVLDTIADGVVVVTVLDYNDNVISKDTISRHEMIMEMARIYDSTEYCYIGRIDTVIASFPDGNPLQELPLYYFDSVYVAITSVLKGSVTPRNFVFADTQSTIKPLFYIENQNTGAAKSSRAGAGQAINYNSYASCKGLTFIFFGNDPFDLRSSTVQPPEWGIWEADAWGGATGFYISDKDLISKTGYSTAGRVNYPGIEVERIDFINAVMDEFLIEHTPIPTFATPSIMFTVTPLTYATDQPGYVPGVRDSGYELIPQDYPAVVEQKRVRGYFTPDSLDGWTAKTEIFVITRILGESGILDNPYLNRHDAQRPEVDIGISAHAGKAVLITGNNTGPVPLSIAIYDSRGRLVSRYDGAVDGSLSVGLPHSANMYFAKVKIGDVYIHKAFQMMR